MPDSARYRTPRHRPATPLVWGGALFVILMGLAACEDSVDPIIDSDQRFTLFATLDMNRDTQYVRVIPIRETVFPQGEPLDVAVRSVDLTRGTTVTWRDSLVTFTGGVVGHVFWAPLRIQPTHRYRVEVLENGEPVTMAETDVPELPVPFVEAEDVRRYNVTQIVGLQRIVWSGLEKPPFRVQHWYRFLDFGTASFVDVPLADNLRRVDPAEDFADAFQVRLNLVADRVVLDTLVDLENYALAGLGMTITVLDGRFEPPGGRFDRTRLAQPGTMSNVEGGFGFVGSVGRFSVEWVLADTSLELLNYQDLSGLTRSVGERPVRTLAGHAVIRGIPLTAR